MTSLADHEEERLRILEETGAGTSIAPKHTVTQYVARTWSGKLTEQPRNG
jgi:Trk K+ transport system NAD-binding subunit